MGMRQPLAERFDQGGHVLGDFPAKVLIDGARVHGPSCGGCGCCADLRKTLQPPPEAAFQIVEGELLQDGTTVGTGVGHLAGQQVLDEALQACADGFA